MKKDAESLPRSLEALGAAGAVDVRPTNDLGRFALSLPRFLMDGTIARPHRM